MPTNCQATSSAYCKRRRIERPFAMTRLAHALKMVQTHEPANRRQQKIIVVLGMHRSGTSLLANLLTSLGVDLGHDLVPADSNNPAGYWEQLDINRTQDRLLSRLNKHWTGQAWMNPFPLAWDQLPQTERIQFKQELAAIVRREIGQSKGVWGFKDPRTCRLWPLWDDVFAEIGIEPLCILALRHPAAVVESLVKRDQMPAAQGEMLWLLHNLEAVRGAGDKLRLVIDYDRWFTSPKEQAYAIAKALDLPWPKAADQVLAGISQRIRPDLRHCEARQSLTLPFIEEAHQILKKAAENGRQPEDLRRIDGEVQRAFACSEPRIAAPPAGAQQTRPPEAKPVESGTARLIAFYLPQFHPTSENDLWWGKGFTEWTNVAGSGPRFEGHHQPQIPGELGFYDLRLPETRKAQADLARSHGLEAFCYWHYWFNGRRVLERPFNEVLTSGQPDFGFCLAWANENWTRRWDGHDKEVLLEQTYGGDEDDRNHFRSLLPAFRDPRAFRIDGKPVFLIYRPGSLPNVSRTLALWRELAREAGLPGLHLMAIRTCFEEHRTNWKQKGFDTELNFQPSFSQELRDLGRELPETGDRVISYSEAWPLMSRAAAVGQPADAAFGCVVPSWDNCARRKREAFIIDNSTPAEYGRWLRQEISLVQGRPEQHRIVFINAWNEWAEGNHLEPDLKWKRAYLEETRRANTVAGRQTEQAPEPKPEPTSNGVRTRASRPNQPKEGVAPLKPASLEAEPTASLLGQAAALRDQGKWQQASLLYQTLTARLPDDLNLWRERIKCVRKQSHKVLANLITREAIMRHPEWAPELQALEFLVPDSTPNTMKTSQTPHAQPAAQSTQALPAARPSQEGDNSVTNRMKREWNERAAEDARYYVHSTKRDQSEEEFDASGRLSVEQCVKGDLPRITGGRDPKTITMLEIGCGLGRMSKHFAGLFGQVHGIDVSGEMIRQASERLKGVANVSLHESSGSDLSLFADESFDFVFSFIVFQHIPDPAVITKYIREAHRVLRPGGVFKFQVQGCTAPAWMKAPKDTWHGATITEEDVDRLRYELGFDLLAKSGQGTQYSWYTLCKPARAVAPSRDSANPPAPQTSTGHFVSVIIPVLNKIELTRKCLAALRKNTPAGQFEVIIWDNGSNDGTQAFFKQPSAGNAAVRYFRSEENLGFVGGNNAAAHQARGQYLVFLNNDTEPQPGWLEALRQTIEANPSIGAVGAKLIYPNGQLQEAGGIIFRDASGWNYGRAENPRDPRFNFIREVDYCSAACLLVRADLFRQLGGFDSRFAPAYYEDTDLCFGLRKAGYKVVYQPRAQIIHHEGATAGQDLNKGYKHYQVVNRQKFFDKWQETLALEPAPNPALVRRASHRVRGQRILVIDPLLPMYDRASGSKRLFEMLKLLVAGGHAVTFIARNGNGGERYAAELEQLGVEVYAGDAERMKECGYIVKCWPFDLQKLMVDSQYDTVILSFWYIAERYISLIRAWSPKSRVVIDTVDVHFLRERRQAELYKDQKLLKQAADTFVRELNVYRQADALITVTNDDRETLLRELTDAKIFVVPNIHDLAKDVPPVDNRNGLLFVGGFSHAPNTDAVLYFHSEIWPRILKGVPCARWTIVGNNPPPAVQALAGPSVQVTGYVPSVEPYLNSHLISIAPLRYGAGMKGKIGEALAAGLPVVTTTIGAEGMGLQNESGGVLVADDPEGLAAHIVTLYTNRALWNKLSAQGRNHMETHFTPRCIERRLRTLLDWSESKGSDSFASIILLAHNQWGQTEKCLRSIARCTPEPHEIILVDNGSTDQTPEKLGPLAAQSPRLRVISNKDHLNFSSACNQAAKTAQGKYLVFLNNDMEVQSNWLGSLLSLAEADPAVAAVGDKILSPDGTIQHAGVALADCWDHDPLLAFHPFAKEQAAFPLANQQRVYQAVSADCMLARKSHFDQVGGFDEQYLNGYEDVDLCLRFQEHGWLTVYEPASVVVHHESESGPERFRRLGENVELFHRKWLEKASPDVIIDQDGKSRISPSSAMRLYSPPTGKVVSIIILAHNQIRDTQQCLASIEKYTFLPHELILVDNASTDGTGQFFQGYAAKHNHVRVILNRTNLGFSAGNNQGLACAQGDFILLLNNDTVATPGWLEHMLAALELYPDCGLVGPVSNSVSGPQLVASADYANLDELPKFAAQWSAAHTGQSSEAGRLVGFCLLLRKAVVERIGGLDPQFGSGNFEDDDLCLRAGLAGFKLRIALDSFVHHTGGQTFKGAKIDYRASLERNWELFKSKWGLPKDAPLEKGYRVPSALPGGFSLRLSLPDLKQSHLATLEGRCWTDKLLGETAQKKPSRKTSTIALPPCALVGQLGEARELVRKKQWPAAWAATLSAISARPYHPEAYLLLAEIALGAGDADSARLCAKAARDMAPGWATPKQFLKGNLRGACKHEWLKLPPALSGRAAAPRVSVCLIAKNEEQFLAKCLQSVRAFASQIVVVDTGSTDRTIEIAEEFGAEVHSFPWCDDFSAARNAALEQATGDWILILDADEEMGPDQKEIITKELSAASILGYRLPIIDKGREQDGCSYVPRLFRNAPGLFFVGRIHEQAFSSIQVRCQQWGLKHQLGKAVLLHHGYASEVMASRNKIERNLRLLERAIEEMPDEAHLIMSLGLELVRSGKLEAGLERYWEAFRLMSELPAVEITPELRETLLTQLTTHLMAARRFSEIVQLWQNPFAKKGGLTASQHFCLAAALMELKQHAEAAEQLRQCIEKRNRPVLSPINREILKAGPHHCLALCLIATNDAKGAQQAFDTALAVEPSSRPVRFDLARFQAAQGRAADALETLRHLAMENPAESQVWELGGQIALSRPEYLEFSCEWTAEAVKNFPTAHNLLRQRAEALMLNHDPAGALPRWRQVQPSGALHQRAALVICELLTGDRQYHFTAAEEPAISQEMVQWYRQCIRMGANALITQLHERMEYIRLTLPTFVRVLEAAHRQARQVAA
jgi:GT2 family glycosyltransferase/SAM-dependent methyltransferase/tetratricopeptide (TPR) repeat protein